MKIKNNKMYKEIKKRTKYMKGIDVAKKYGVSTTTVSNIKNSRNFKWYKQDNRDRVCCYSILKWL